MYNKDSEFLEKHKKLWRSNWGQPTTFNPDKHYGWFAPNSLIARDCIPTWGTIGGGVMQVGKFRDALIESISNTRQRMKEAELQMVRLEEMLDELDWLE